MNHKINIDLFRISSDSLYLDMIFECDSTFHFTSCLLNVMYSVEGKAATKKFDLSAYLFGSEESNKRKKWSVRMPLSKIGFGPETPAIYIAHFKATPDVLSPEATELNDEAVCSDVNNIYYTLVDGILNPGERCTPVSDEVIRNYIILYAHQLALELREFDEAFLYFRMINNGFNNCAGYQRLPNAHNHSCNCSK